MRARGFFSGYYKDAPATEQAWAGGWFHTGDLVRVGEDGALFLRRSLEKRDSAQRREHRRRRSRERSAGSPRRARVGRLSRCRTRCGARKFLPSSCCAPRCRPRDETAAHLQRHCRQALAYYKAPGYIGFCEGLPQTASQKLARGAIKALGKKRHRKRASLRSAGSEAAHCRRFERALARRRVARDYVLGLNYFL